MVITKVVTITMIIQAQLLQLLASLSTVTGGSSDHGWPWSEAWPTHGQSGFGPQLGDLWHTTTTATTTTTTTATTAATASCCCCHCCFDNVHKRDYHDQNNDKNSKNSNHRNHNCNQSPISTDQHRTKHVGEPQQPTTAVLVTPHKLHQPANNKLVTTSSTKNLGSSFIPHRSFPGQHLIVFDNDIVNGFQRVFQYVKTVGALLHTNIEEIDFASQLSHDDPLQVYHWQNFRDTVATLYYWIF